MEITTIQHHGSKLPLNPKEEEDISFCTYKNKDNHSLRKITST